MSWTCRPWSTSATRTPTTLPPPRQKARRRRTGRGKVIRGIHGVCERANSLLKTTFTALRRVSLDPSGITKIAAAVLVLLQIERDRTI